MNPSAGSGGRSESGDIQPAGADYDRIVESVWGAARALERAGATLREIDLDLSEYVVPAYYIIACAEASSNLSRFDGVKYGHRAAEYEGLHDMLRKSRTEGFGEEVRRRIRLGTFVLSEGYYDAYYKKACRVRRLIRNAYDRVLEEVDMILTPVTPDVAPRLGESLADPLRMYQSDLFTIPANLTGLPAVSFPCGTITEGERSLPIGAQLTGRAFSDRWLLEVAGVFRFPAASRSVHAPVSPPHPMAHRIPHHAHRKPIRSGSPHPFRDHTRTPR